MWAKSLSKPGIACFSHVAVDIAEAEHEFSQEFPHRVPPVAYVHKYAGVGGLGRTCERDWR